MPKTEDGYFSQPTRDALFAWAGAECSAPWCKTRTIAGSTSTKSGVSDVGEAAHILGRTPKSARYKKTQSPADRIHFSNGIWMCREHGAIIDRNDSIYTKELLLQWKEARHEEAHRDQSGRPSKGLADLFDFQLTIDLDPKPSLNSIIEFMQAAGVSASWGDDAQGAAARVSFELLYNAQRHGTAKSATLQTSGKEVRVTFESPEGHFGVDQLLQANNRRGGHISVASWRTNWNAQFRLASHSAGTSTTWTLTDIRDGTGAFGPCSTVVQYAQMTDRSHGPYSPDCSEVILYIKGGVSFSDVIDLIPTVTKALTDRPVLIVSKDDQNLKVVEAVNEYRELGWKLTRSGSSLRVEL